MSESVRMISTSTLKTTITQGSSSRFRPCFLSRKPIRRVLPLLASSSSIWIMLIILFQKQQQQPNSGSFTVEAFSSTKTCHHRQHNCYHHHHHHTLIRKQTNIGHPFVSLHQQTSTLLKSSNIVNDIKLHDHSVTIAGTLWPVLHRFYITRTKWMEIIYNVKSITEWQEIVILPFVAFAFHPIMSFLFYRNKGVKTGSTDDESISGTKNDYKNNQLSWYNLSARFGQIGQVALSVYVMDVISVILTTIGFTFPYQIQLSTSYMKIAYTSLFVSQLLLYKKIALCKVFDVKIDQMGQVDILNRFLNGIIVTIGALFIFDWLSVKMGRAVTGIFAFGSVGALAFTLASEGLVKELLSGVVLVFGSKLNVGDKVIFGDGTPCTISKIGWLETMVRGSDNIETRVPNTELASKTVSNISRSRLCQVKQTLRFRYEDSKKIPQIITDIKKEIMDSCPKLITDKSIRPFRVYWTDFKEDHLEVMVDTHHNIAPSGDEYWMNRQNLLTAILRAVEKNNAELQHESG